MADLVDIPHDSHGEYRPGGREVAALAKRQGGVVSYQQLVALGLQRGSIEHWLRSGRLHRVHIGVYAVGHSVLGNSGRLMAAVLACGPGAVVSHRSAAD